MTTAPRISLVRQCLAGPLRQTSWVSNAGAALWLNSIIARSPVNMFLTVFDVFEARCLIDDAACALGDAGATAMQRRKGGSLAGGMWGEVVTSVMASLCRCGLRVRAEREVRRRSRSFRQ